MTNSIMQVYPESVSVPQRGMPVMIIMFTGQRELSGFRVVNCAMSFNSAVSGAI